MGSVNASQFLNDATGSRRFLCFETLQIDYRHKIDIDQCYAQALFLFKQGTFKHWFDESEIDEINKNNEFYQISSVEEEMLLSSFDPCTKEEATHTINASQILIEIMAKGKYAINTPNKVNIGKACTKNGFIRFKKDSVWVYALREKKQDNPKSENPQSTLPL